MKSIDAEALKRLYPPMTEEFSARMGRLIRRLPQEEDIPKMKKKISVGLALAAALILAAATALAAGLGVFAQLADARDPDARLSDLDAVASAVHQSVTTEDGVTVTIDQAYYDGERVFISYRMQGDLIRTEEGKGEIENVEWMNEEYGIAVDPDFPGAQAVAALQNGEEGDWVRVRSVEMHDGLRLQDGTYLNIIGGEYRLLADGTEIGWKECLVPPEVAADTLECKATLFRAVTTYQKHGGKLRAGFGRMDKSTDTDVPFTVRKETAVTRLTGEKQTAAYTAQAECTLNGVDIKCLVTLKYGDAWMRDWINGGYTKENDLIEGWALYSGDESVGSEVNDLGYWGEGDQLCFERIIRHGGHTENLRLAPIYTLSGEHPEEAIELQAE